MTKGRIITSIISNAVLLYLLVSTFAINDTNSMSYDFVPLDNQTLHNANLVELNSFPETNEENGLVTSMIIILYIAGAAAFIIACIIIGTCICCRRRNGNGNRHPHDTIEYVPV